MEGLQQADTPAMRECCQDLTNRSEPIATDDADLTFTRCGMCGARHFILLVPPMETEAEGSAI